jgi:uncharacterized protein involved in exopolysaccharide biosynthesis
VTNEPFESSAAHSTDVNPLSLTDWREYYLAVRQGFLPVLLCLALGVLVAALYLSRQEARFQARAVLLIHPGQFGESGFAIDRPTLAQQVSRRLKLNEDPGFPAYNSKASRITHSEADGALVGLVTMKFRRHTRLIDITVTHPDPAHAVTVANAYADEFVRRFFNERAEDFLAMWKHQKPRLDEFEPLQRQMRASYEAMQRLRQRVPTSSITSLQAATRVKLAQLGSEMAKIEQKMAQVDADLEAARASSGKPKELLRFPSVAVVPQVAHLTPSITDQEREVLLLGQRYHSTHPAHLAARMPHDLQVAARNSMLSDVPTLLKTLRQNLQGQYDETEKSRAEQEARFFDLTVKSVVYENLKWKLEADLANYSDLIGSIQASYPAMDPPNSLPNVHERAASATPVDIGTRKIYVLGCLVGLAIGLGIIFIRHSSGPSIKSVA